jgi:hypothetical protein
MRMSSRLLAAAALGLPFAALAGPSDYVHEPSVEYGERELDFKYGTARYREDGTRESEGSLGFGYGATQWWFTEAYVKYHKLPGDSTRYDAVEWENKFQLTEPNQYPVDFGLFTEIEVPKEHRTEGYELKVGALVQGDAGPIRWNANLLLERVVRGEESHVTEMGYELQAKYHVRREFEFGVQAFGEMGKWDHWAAREEQSHRVGPAVFGKVKLEGRQTLRYNAAWLVGSNAAARHTFRLQTEYEF